MAVEVDIQVETAIPQGTEEAVRAAAEVVFQHEAKTIVILYQQ